jgi:hypothetical protein
MNCKSERILRPDLPRSIGGHRDYRELQSAVGHVHLLEPRTSEGPVKKIRISRASPSTLSQRIGVLPDGRASSAGLKPVKQLDTILG